MSKRKIKPIKVRKLIQVEIIDSQYASLSSSFGLTPTPLDFLMAAASLISEATEHEDWDGDGSDHCYSTVAEQVHRLKKALASKVISEAQ